MLTEGEVVPSAGRAKDKSFLRIERTWSECVTVYFCRNCLVKKNRGCFYSHCLLWNNLEHLNYVKFRFCCQIQNHFKSLSKM